MSKPTLIISLKEEFQEAARQQDFSKPELAAIKTLLDTEGLALTPLNTAANATRLAEVFFVVGDKAHDRKVVDTLGKSPAVSSIEKPAPRRLI